MSAKECSGFQVWDLRFRVFGFSGFRVWDLGSRVVGFSVGK